MLPSHQRHQLMLDSISTLMDRYAGNSSGPVVNEAFDQMGNPTHRVVGHHPTATDTSTPPARPVAPIPQYCLYYNDHGAELTATNPTLSIRPQGI